MLMRTWTYRGFVGMRLIRSFGHNESFNSSGLGFVDVLRFWILNVQTFLQLYFRSCVAWSGLCADISFDAVTVHLVSERICKEMILIFGFAACADDAEKLEAYWMFWFIDFFFFSFLFLCFLCYRTKGLKLRRFGALLEVLDSLIGERTNLFP